VKRILVAVALGILIFPPQPSHSQQIVTVRNDNGGAVQAYYKRNAQYGIRKQKVRFLGVCKSACTVMLKHVDCVSPYAEFHFHSPSMHDGRSEAPEQEHWVYDPLPEGVKRWIDANGGLSSKWLVLKGDEMRAILPVCAKGARVPWQS
jgi:hypothetical protein